MKSVTAQLSLHAFQIPVRLGVSEEENRHPQDVVFDLDIFFPERPPGCQTDKISDTICYDRVCTAIRDVCAAQTYHLIEYLAERTYAELSQIVSPATIQLKVTKLAPPVMGLREGASFTIFPNAE